MISILHKMFLESSIKQIDNKYQEQLHLDEEKLLTYSNIFNLPLYYKIAPFKKLPDYNFYNKLQQNKVLETIYFMIDKILESNYNSDLILLLYSYISNIYLNKMMDNYIEPFLKEKILLSKKKAMKLRSKIASSIESYIYFTNENKHINKYKITTKKLEICEEANNVLNQISVKFHYFSFGKDVFEISFNNFKKYQKRKQSFFKGIHKLTAKLLDVFSRSKKYSAYSIYHNYKINNKYLLINDLDFTILYNKTLNEVSTLLTLVSEEIFYKKKNSKIIEKILKK